MRMYIRIRKLSNKLLELVRMPAPAKPQQERSRRTLEKLLAATAQMLEQHGLEGATIPRIAAQAGVSVGAVYRRFQDKDALFRAAFISLIEHSVEVNKRNLIPETFAGLSLESVAKALARAMVRQFRTQPGLLAALQHFLQHQPDAEFRERALEMIAGNYQRIASVLLLFRERMTLADPEQAALFAILTATTVIQARTLENDSVWQKVAPLNDADLEVEVAALIVAYLTRTGPAGAAMGAHSSK
jgi:AcrR family transcriptional regulator